MRDHGLELVVLRQSVVLAVKDCDLDGTVLDQRMLLERVGPELHEFTLQTVDGGADFVGLLFLGHGRADSGHGQGHSQRDKFQNTHFYIS